MQLIEMGQKIERILQAIANNFAELERDKADASEVPAKVSQLENDAGFQTAAQVEAAVAALVNAAPETLDTLKELADALNNDPGFATTVTTSLAGKPLPVPRRYPSGRFTFSAAMRPGFARPPPGTPSRCRWRGWRRTRRRRWPGRCRC